MHKINKMCKVVICIDFLTFRKLLIFRTLKKGYKNALKKNIKNERHIKKIATFATF